MAVKAPQNDQFPTGFIRVSAFGAKGWGMIDFTQVLPRFLERTLGTFDENGMAHFQFGPCFSRGSAILSQCVVKSPPRKIQLGP